MVHTEYIGARMRYRAEQRARRRKHALTIMRNICGVAAFVLFMLVLGKAGASDCGAAWEEIFPSTFILPLVLLFQFWRWNGWKDSDKNILEKLKNVLAFLVIVWYNKENRGKRITL